MTEIEFNRIFNKYRMPVFIFVRNNMPDYNPFIAEEITSKVFIKMWEKQPHFNSDIKARAWIFVSAKRQILDATKAKKHTIPITEDENDLTDRDQHAIDLAEIHAEFMKKVIMIIKGYTEHERLIFNLFFMETLTPGMIAKILKTKPQTVANQIQVLKNKLRGHIKKPPILFR